jgi:transposase
VRDFRRLAERSGTASEIGQAALALCERLSAAWHRYRGEGRGRAWLGEQIAPLRHKLRTLLERGQTEGDGETKTLCRSLLKLWPALSSFVDQEGVEPTNNAAERGLHRRGHLPQDELR